MKIPPLWILALNNVQALDQGRAMCKAVWREGFAKFAKITTALEQDHPIRAATAK
jgi:hypothetical protein